ncbi:hypothetical protein DY000_02016716 [Brassica cretica]|uniref:Uncharacterized protein n=1 Tax=Brassica cretica TaxID=69181 RepID=A0ABQ7CLF3_BRACR|nr:hypothetical protein DY000_02016716 [Brassica cretica]
MNSCVPLQSHSLENSWDGCVKMSGSIDFKRKRLMEDEYGQTAEEGYKKGKAELRERAGLFDIQAEKDRLRAKLLCAEEKLKAIEVRYIDWEKLGESWFLSQP